MPQTSLTGQDSPLTTNLPCTKCHYNLRTKRPSELCPECAHPVADSIRQHQNAILPDPRLAATGAFLLAAAAFGGVLWTALQLCTVFGYVSTRWSWDWLATPLLFFLLLIAATQFIGFLRFINGTVFLGPLRTALRLAAILLAPPAAIAYPLAATTLWTGISRPLWLDSRFPPFAITSCSLNLALLLILTPWLMTLARRLRWNIFAGITAYFIPLAALNVLAAILCVYAWWLIFPTWNFSSFGFKTFDSLRFSIDYAGAIITLAFSIYWLTIALLLRKQIPRP